jgi:hypothetical protein
VAFIGGGVAVIGGGVATLINDDTRTRLRQLLTWLTHEPAGHLKPEPDDGAGTSRNTTEPAA